MPRVLVVEDDPLVGTTVCRALRDAGLQPELVTTFAGAQAALARGGFDGCSTDLTLPNSDGLDVVAEAVTAGIPVVVFTGHDDSALFYEARRRGAADCFTKPEGLAQLAPTLWREIRGRTEDAMSGERTKQDLAAVPEGEAREAAERVLRRRASDKRAVMSNRFGWGMLSLSAVIALASVVSDVLAKRPIQFPVTVMTMVVLLAFGGGALLQGVTLDRILTAWRKSPLPPSEPPDPAA